MSTFLPANFSHVSAAYQRPCGNLILFLNDYVYQVKYPSLQLVLGWPINLQALRFSANVKINTAITTNTRYLQ